MNTLNIKIGETEYTIKEFTLGTLENLQEVVLTATAGLDSNPREEFTRHINILSTALVQDYPDLTPDGLRTRRIGGTIQTVAAAVREVMRFAGFVVAAEAIAEGASPGEAPARAEA